MSVVARLLTGCLILLTLAVFAVVAVGYSVFRFTDTGAVRGEWSESLGGAGAISASIDVDHGDVTVADSLPAGPALGGDVAIRTEYRAGGDTPIVRDWRIEDGAGIATLGSASADPPHAVLRWLRSPEQATWDLGVNPQVPLDLAVDVAVGSARVDLTGLTVTHFLVNVAVGSADIVVGDAAAATGTSRIRVGVGDGRLAVPEDVPVRIQVTAGISDVSSADGFLFDGRYYTNDAWQARTDLTTGMDIVVETGKGNVSLATLTPATPGPVAGTASGGVADPPARKSPLPTGSPPAGSASFPVSTPPSRSASSPVDSPPDDRRP